MSGAASLRAVALEYAPMGLDDLAWVVQIEQATNAHPWSRQHFADSLSAGYSAWVMRAEGQAMGYGVMLLVGDEAHLLTISVHPAHQGRGLGALLLTHLGAVAQRFGALQMFLEVRPSNAAALAYYPAAQGREDALVMRWSMS